MIYSVMDNLSTFVSDKFKSQTPSRVMHAYCTREIAES